MSLRSFRADRQEAQRQRLLHGCIVAGAFAVSTALIFLHLSLSEPLDHSAGSMERLLDWRWHLGVMLAALLINVAAISFVAHQQRSALPRSEHPRSTPERSCLGLATFVGAYGMALLFSLNGGLFLAGLVTEVTWVDGSWVGPQDDEGWGFFWDSTLISALFYASGSAAILLACWPFARTISRWLIAPLLLLDLWILIHGGAVLLFQRLG